MFLEWEKSNEVVDYYPAISVQETKNNKEINLDLNKKLVRFTTHLKNTSITRNTHTHTHTHTQTVGYIAHVMVYYARNR